MKTGIFTFVFIGILFTACKKSNNGPAIVTNPKTVDSIVLQVQKVNTPVSNIKFTGDNYSWFQMMGGNIYVSNYTSPNSLLYAYSIATNTFQARIPNNHMCGCGYESKLVTDGANLFYIANYADTWNYATNTWTVLNYPSSAKSDNGEAGVVYYKNKIYFLGGRTASNLFKYYDIASTTWNYAANYLYTDQGYNQMTVVNDTLYALGGRNYLTKFSRFTESGGWQALPDLPFSQSLSAGGWKLASFKSKYIFSIADNGKIYVYSTVSKQWKAQPISTGITDTFLNLFADDNNLYIAGVNGSNQDFSLNKVAVSNLPQ